LDAQRAENLHERHFLPCVTIPISLAVYPNMVPFAFLRPSVD
jgi:hypothetical protein